jgi:hypothetical protein
LTAAYISRDDPRTLIGRAPVLQHFRSLGADIVDISLISHGRQILADLGVRWVVLDRYKMPGGAERSYTEETAQRVFAGQTPVYEDERLTVYEVPPVTLATPYAILGDGWGALDAAQGTRTFHGSAEVKVRAPSPTYIRLRLTPAPGSAALRLPSAGSEYALDIAVQAGDNVIMLETLQPEATAIVAGLAVEPAGIGGNNRPFGPC